MTIAKGTVQPNLNRKKPTKNGALISQTSKMVERTAYAPSSRPHGRTPSQATQSAIGKRIRAIAVPTINAGTIKGLSRGPQLSSGFVSSIGVVNQLTSTLYETIREPDQMTLADTAALRSANPTAYRNSSPSTPDKPRSSLPQPTPGYPGTTAPSCAARWQTSPLASIPAPAPPSSR